MKTTLDSLKFLTQILWEISTPRKKIQTLFIIIISIFSSALQYINILLTAYTFSFITSSVYSENKFFEINFLFGNFIQFPSFTLLNIIIFWIISSIFAYGTLIISSFLIYKSAYSYGQILSKRCLEIAMNSNSVFYENISEKTLFNLFSGENTLLVKGSITSLIILPMQVSIILSLLTIIIKYSVTPLNESDTLDIKVG